MAKMDRFELVFIHTSHPVPRGPSAAALGADGGPRQILVAFNATREGKGLSRMNAVERERKRQIRN